MNDVHAAAQPVMRHSFSGRVRNYNLPPTAQNALMPVFEALTNSLYAIQERFPENWPDEGVIRVEVLRAPESENESDHNPVTGFVISDNGLGLDDRLFGYFQELDTEYRAAKKGRGIGRLSWLKVFVKAEVVSIFNRDDARMERSFTFQLSNEHPFTHYRETSHVADQDTGTIVSLSNFRELFRAKAHDDPIDIQNAILAHFIALFAQPKRLRIDLVDEGKTTNLSDLFFDSIVKGEGPFGDKTPFHCFLIAEPSEQLYSLLRSHAIYKPTPDGDGRFGYIDDLNAYFEFIPYDQVLRNASLRNEAFFKKLNLVT